jgi:hypothetical protein
MKKQILLFLCLSCLCVAHSKTLAASDGSSFSVLTTAVATSITKTTVVTGGNITDQGTSPVLARGVCWSLNSNPTITDNVTTDGAGVGIFTSSVAGLMSGLTYHIRAYATNDASTAYGDDLTFTTLGTEPTVTTTITTTDHVTTDADGAGVFSSAITGLTSGVTYLFGPMPRVLWVHRMVLI